MLNRLRLAEIDKAPESPRSIFACAFACAAQTRIRGVPTRKVETLMFAYASYRFTARAVSPVRWASEPNIQADVVSSLSIGCPSIARKSDKSGLFAQNPCNSALLRIDR